MTTVWGRKTFHECVPCVCFTFGTIFLVIAFLMARGFLMGVMTINCTAKWIIKISFKFKNSLIYNVFIWKHTKLLVYLPWPSRKQSTSFISSNSNSVFLTCSFLSANTHWSTTLRRLGLLEGAQMFFVLFYQDSLFRDIGHFVHSSVLLFEIDHLLQIIKELSTLDNNFATKFVLGKCTQTVHMLAVETECVQFL